LAFGGFAAAVDGFTRGRAVFGLLAALDLACIILSGARMALLATALLLACLLLTSAAFRERLKRAKLLLMGTLSGLTVLAVGYGPTLIRRTLMHNRAGGLDVFRRADTWQFYLDDWLASPWFGRGFGSGFVAGPERVLDVVPPHDEYLHLLLIGGIVGGALLLVSITRWAWRLFRDAPPDARPFVLSLGLALAFYAIAENLLAYVAALPVFAYLGLVARSAARERPS
jgi:O-antigen ligase